MDLSLTTKAQEALSTAVRDAAAAGHAQVEPAHLLRALAQQTGWARSLDAASQRYHHIQRKELVDAAAAAQAAAAPAKAPASKEGQTPAPDDGTSDEDPSGKGEE